MANKPPGIRIAGIRSSIPSGYILGRTSTGHGDVELLSMQKLQSVGLIPTTLPGPPTGPAGGDLSGTYPDPTVVKLQGRPVAATAPANLAVLLYHTTGATWLPVLLGAVAYSNDYNDLTNLPTIHNVPAGGTTGQVLTKNSNTDYDISWVTPSAGGSSGAPASIQDDGTNISLALSDSSGQLILDGSSNPIFAVEVFPVAAMPALTGYLSGPYSAAVVNKVKGVTNGSSAAAGDVGEVIRAFLPNASSISPVNAVPQNIITLLLTPGDWDVSATGFAFPFNLNMTSMTVGISLVSNTLPNANADPEGSAEISSPFTLSASSGFNIAPTQFNVSVNTTLYLVINVNYTGAGTMFCWGSIRARRMR